MKLRSGLFILLILLTGSASAAGLDSITVRGKITADSGVTMSSLISTIELFTYKTSEQNFTTKPAEDGTFTFKVRVAQTTLFELKYRSYRLNLMLTPDEPSCQVSIRCGKADAQIMTTLNSRENEAYNKYLRRTNNALKEDLKNLGQECAAGQEACDIKLKSISALQNMKMEYVREKYKGTYAADLATMAEMPDLKGSGYPVQDMQRRFFERIDLTDMKLYATPDLGDKISIYLDFIADTIREARFAFVNGMLQQTKNKPEAERELLSLLLNTFINTDREAYLATLVQWAALQKKLGDEQPVIAAKIALISKLIPGCLAPEVEGKDTSGATTDLSSFTKKNKLTMLIFWETDCPHCRRAMPDLNRTYRRYQAQGLGVFAASMDTEVDKWKRYINGAHLTWQNVILPENTNAHGDYFIQYTPTIVLIDQQGKIVRRFMEVNDVDQVVGGILAK